MSNKNSVDFGRSRARLSSDSDKKSFKDAILSKINLDPNISKKLATLDKLKEVQNYHKNFNFKIDNALEE